MSWRLSLDVPSNGKDRDFDFTVGENGSLEDMLREYGWQRPLKVYFDGADKLREFLDIWERDYSEASDVWRYYRYVGTYTELKEFGTPHPDREELERLLSETN